MMEEQDSSETLVLTRATLRNIPVDDILQIGVIQKQQICYYYDLCRRASISFKLRITHKEKRNKIE
jgi:hypothetical protein